MNAIYLKGSGNEAVPNRAEIIQRIVLQKTGRRHFGERSLVKNNYGKNMCKVSVGVQYLRVSV